MSCGQFKGYDSFFYGYVSPVAKLHLEYLYDIKFLIPNSGYKGKRTIPVIAASVPQSPD
jgi:hypothetical protein